MLEWHGHSIIFLIFNVLKTYWESFCLIADVVWYYWVDKRLWWALIYDLKHCKGFDLSQIFVFVQNNGVISISICFPGLNFRTCFTLDIISLTISSMLHYLEPRTPWAVDVCLGVNSEFLEPFPPVIVYFTTHVCRLWLFGILSCIMYISSFINCLRSHYNLCLPIFKFTFLCTIIYSLLYIHYHKLHILASVNLSAVDFIFLFHPECRMSNLHIFTPTRQF